MSSNNFTPVTHVIFDVDGLLLDTESLYTKIFQKICAPYGRDFTWDVKLRMMGKKQAEAAVIFAEEYDKSMTVDTYKKIVDDHISREFPNAQFLPGAERLVRHLHKHGIPLAIATGSHQEEYDLKTSNHQDIFGLFSHTVMSSNDPEVKHGKPAPDCFLIAAQRFSDSPDPSKVLVFEDAPNGVQGALAAGMQVVWVPDSNVKTDSLGVTATQTLTSLEHFIPQEFGLPPYDQKT